MAEHDSTANNSLSAPTRELQCRSNNAYDTMLLVENGVVIGVWDVYTTGAVEDFTKSLYGKDDLSGWRGTDPDMTNPEEYGLLVMVYRPKPRWQGPFASRRNT